MAEQNKLKDLLQNVAFVAAIVMGVCALMMVLSIIHPHIIEVLNVLLEINDQIFADLLLYVFIISGVILAGIRHWVGLEDRQGGLLNRPYKSKQVVKDYYTDAKKIDHEKVIREFISASPPKKLSSTDDDLDEKLADDIVRTFFQDGSLEKEVGYKEGKLHGAFRTYYANGRIHNEKFYKDGQLHGLCRAFDENGIPFFEIDYKEGKQHGQDRIFYRTGVVQYIDTYVEGKRINRKTYSESGELKFDQNFK